MVGDPVGAFLASALDGFRMHHKRRRSWKLRQNSYSWTADRLMVTNLLNQDAVKPELPFLSPVRTEPGFS
jgi:hypothetical protein